IKLVALSQLSNLKNKISTRGIPLSSVMPFYNKKFYTSFEFSKCLLIPVGVDKSCCGPHNNNIFKKTEKLIDSLLDLNKNIGILTIGRKMKDFFRKYYTVYLVGHVYNIDKEPLSFTISSVLSSKIYSQNWDKYYFIFNRYYSPFTQKTQIYEIVGASQFNKVGMNYNNVRKLTTQQDYFSFFYDYNDGRIFSLVNEIYDHNFAMIVLDVLEENEYSGLGARVTAMDNSGQNAVKMIEVMTLLYNKARQASITNELIEIASAANFV
ncbi:MAG: FoF1 ATP synthase subunit gamma, partial [Candidatus Sericytochromatia bacterium]